MGEAFAEVNPDGTKKVSEARVARHQLSIAIGEEMAEKLVPWDLIQVNQEVENQIAWSRKRQIKRLELQLKLQQDLDNLGRGEMLKDKINKLKKKK